MEWSKHGAYPVSVLPDKDIGSAGRIWTHLANNPEGREACGWLLVTEPEYDPYTEMLVWVTGDVTTPGYYSVEPKPANPVTPKPQYFITQKELMDLFTTTEQTKIKIEQKTVDEMTAAQFSQPQSMVYQLFSVAMDQFERSKAIELHNPQTIAAIKQIFVLLGIITSARADQILSNTPPTV